MYRMSRILTANLVIAFLFLCSSSALAGVDPLGECYGEIAYSGPGIPVLCNVPDGSGDPLTEAQLEYGARVDATLTLYLRDAMADPIQYYPAEDLWLESVDHGLTACLGGTTADGPSNQDGIATWTVPLRAGGFSQTLTQMMISGSPLITSAGFGLHHNSPDINGDGVVNLVDVSLFAQDFAAGYVFRSDFFRDGIVNLSDLGKLAVAMGRNCP